MRDTFNKAIGHTLAFSSHISFEKAFVLELMVEFENDNTNGTLSSLVFSEIDVVYKKKTAQEEKLDKKEVEFCNKNNLYTM